MKISLTRKDGKVVGACAWQVNYTLANGPAAPLSGKTYTFPSAGTAPNQLRVDVKDK